MQGKFKNIAKCSIALVLFIIGIIASNTIGPRASANNTIKDVLDRPTSYFYDIKRSMDRIKINQGLYDSDINLNVHAFIKMNAQLERIHSFSLLFGERVNDLIADGEVLNGDQLDTFKNLMAAYHYAARRMLEFTSIYSMEKETDRKQPVSRSLTQTKRNLIWLAANITLYDNFADGHRSYFSDSKVRRILKDILKTQQMKSSKFLELQAMIAHVLDDQNRKELRKIIKAFKNQIKDAKAYSETDDQLATLYRFITSNKSTQNIYSKAEASFHTYTLRDNVVNFFGTVTNIVSKFFGNSVGAIRWRGGFLYGNKKIESEYYSLLRPLDIVLEKTPFALTDKFIPGNFGHAALYLGTEKQLKEIRMWNHPSIIPYQKEIRNGKTIIEAVRPGVRLTTLEHFLQIDEFMILRHKNALKNVEDIENRYSRAMAQMYKEYDFNFDVETTNKIVCSELLFMAFGKVNWPIEYIMGRPTISPDNLAELALYENSPIMLKNYTIAHSKNKIEEVDEKGLAPKIGYKLVRARSSDEKYSFDKELISCKTISKRKLRMGSRRKKYRKVRVCKKKYKHYIYNPDPKKRSVNY